MDFRRASRRDFIVGLGAFSAAFTVGALRAAELAPFKVSYRKVALKLGAAEPFTMIHFSDSHLTEATVEELAAIGTERAEFHAKRVKTLSRNAKSFAATLKAIKERGLFAVNTGDLLDYVSEGGLSMVGEQKGLDILTTPGNHEIMMLDSAKKLKKRKMYEELSSSIAKAYGCKLPVEAKVIKGVKFVTLDNAGLSRYDMEIALTALKREFEGDMPTVLCCHFPPFSQELLNKERKHDQKKSASAWMMCGEKVEGVEPKPEIKAIVDYLKSRDNLKAVLSGHLHGFYQGMFNEKVPLVVAPANYAGHAVELEIT